MSGARQPLDAQALVAVLGTDVRREILIEGTPDHRSNQRRFRELREGAKYEHMLDFADALPTLRERVAADMRKRGLGRDKVLATVVHLLEATMIRVGNQSYAKENKSYGLTTLRGRHVEVEGGELRFHFKGKSGKAWRLGLRDRRVANIVRSCQELPGQHLFQYLDDEEREQVRSVALERWQGAPDAGRWIQQTTLAIPTTAKVAQSA